MGTYFRMSFRFNKIDAADFGLTELDANTAVDLKDGTIWNKKELYDHGWGKELGYYKTPMPDVDTLFDIALHSRDKEDAYGAAAVILELYSEELLLNCESIMDDPAHKKEFRRMAKLFDLKNPINRCCTALKPLEQIKAEYYRWKRVAEKAKHA